MIPRSHTWRPPDSNELKLNVDGAWDRTRGAAGVGGVIRDKEGIYVGGFAKRIPFDTRSRTSEGLAILEGLKFSIADGFRKLIIENNALTVIEELKRMEMGNGKKNPKAPMVIPGEGKKKSSSYKASLDRFIKGKARDEEKMKRAFEEEKRRMEDMAEAYKAKASSFIVVDGKKVDPNKEALFKFLERNQAQEN